MLMFLGHIFVMAEIAAMRETAEHGTWIPLKMRDNSVPPKIASFAAVHDPALLYAELLRKYTSGQLLGVAYSSGNQWYSGQGTSGYFCQHDGFVSFVVGTQDLISNQTRLNQILSQFKSNYGKVFATQQPITAELPPPTEPTAQQLESALAAIKGLARETALQKITDTLKAQKILTVAALLKADQKLFSNSIETSEKKTFFGGLVAPHIHQYDASNGLVSRVFCYLNMFIVFDLPFETKPDTMLLFRPHAYMLDVDGITSDIYKKKGKNIIWPEIQTKITFSDGSSQKYFKTSNFSFHGSNQSSFTSPEIGKFSDLLKKGPFVSEIISPEKYKKKTLHMLFDTIGQAPDTVEKLLVYLSQLPLDQQKFIIKQLFPFLAV